MANLNITQGIDIDTNLYASYPAGSIIVIGGNSYSSYSDINSLGFCPCDGRSLNTYTYRVLHKVISNTYGGTAYSAGVTDIPSASTTFSVPNLVDSTNNDPYFIIGSSGTKAVGSKSPDASRRHTHANPNTGNTYNSGTGSFPHNHAGTVNMQYANHGGHYHSTGAFYAGLGNTPGQAANRNATAPQGYAAYVNHNHGFSVGAVGYYQDDGPHVHSGSTYGYSTNTAQNAAQGGTELTSHFHTVNATYNTDTPTGVINLIPYVVSLFFIKL